MEILELLSSDEFLQGFAWGFGFGGGTLQIWLLGRVMRDMRCWEDEE